VTHTHGRVRTTYLRPPSQVRYQAAPQPAAPFPRGRRTLQASRPRVPSGISLQRHAHAVTSPTDSRSSWGRRLAIAIRRLRSRLRSRCGGGVPISNTGDEGDDGDDQRYGDRESGTSAFAVAQVAQRPNRDDLTQEHRDNRDRTKSCTSTRVLETQSDHDDRGSPHGQD